jgi:peptidoglycan/LPS O-acetylase OafA/YrhL
MANFVNNRTQASANLYLGMCLPAVCNKTFVMDLMNEEMSNMQTQIIQMVGAPLAVGNIDLNPQDDVFSTSGWFYFTLTFLALLLFMSVFSIFWGWRKKKEKYSTLDKVIQSFSLTESMKIFVYKSNYLNIFNGIKAICMFWVIFGHQFSVRLKYDVNIIGIPGQVEKFFYLFVTGAFLAVDVFFFIGGFLVAYSFLREKSKSILKYPMAVLHRVLRFWPSYIMAILLYYSVYIHSNSGPLWKANLTLGQIPYC